MLHKIKRYLHSVLRYSKVLLFAIIWFLGIAAGVFFSVNAGDTYYILMRRAAWQLVSIPGLATSVLLPIIFVDLAFRLDSSHLLYCICFIKAFMFSASSVCVCAAFGSAAWLVGFLLQFSDFLTLPVFGWFVIHGLIYGHTAYRSQIPILVWYLLVMAADYTVISPFLAGLSAT